MRYLHDIKSRLAAGILLLMATAMLGGCRGAKLSVANEQFERGEYFEAQKTYRKVYNKLTKREQRPQRGAEIGRAHV